MAHLSIAHIDRASQADHDIAYPHTIHQPLKPFAIHSRFPPSLRLLPPIPCQLEDFDDISEPQATSSHNHCFSSNNGCTNRKG